MRAFEAIAVLINSAVIVLSKALYIGRDHLIHRKRSPFPYEGKALTPPKVGTTYNVERNPLIAATLRSPKYGSVVPDNANQAHIKPCYCPSP